MRNGVALWVGYGGIDSLARAWLLALAHLGWKHSGLVGLVGLFGLVGLVGGRLVFVDF